MYTISKEFTIDYAHRLILPYESKCQYLHGHTAKIKLELSTNDINDSQMVLDFTHLNNFIDKIKSKFDHATIINSDDTSLVNFCIETKQRRIIFQKVNPTAEVFSKYFVQELIDFYQLDTNVWEVSCTFWETPTNSAKFTSAKITSTKIKPIQENKNHIDLKNITSKSNNENSLFNEYNKNDDGIVDVIFSAIF